jgi:uncharacterized protein (TIGR00725 family)
MTKKISVFGSSNPKSGSETYQMAYELGQLLGSAGMSVLTGGYMGTMEATSRGASEAGGHVIGVTSDEIEQWRPVGPNQWIKEEWRCKTFQERLTLLVEKCDAAITLPGGIGTLLEVCLAWNKLVVDVLKPKPLILIGKEWQRVIETFYNELGDYIPLDSREYLAFAPDPNAAVELMNHFLNINQ